MNKFIIGIIAVGFVSTVSIVAYKPTAQLVEINCIQAKETMKQFGTTLDAAIRIKNIWPKCF